MGKPYHFMQRRVQNHQGYSALFELSLKELMWIKGKTMLEKTNAFQKICYLF